MEFLSQPWPWYVAGAFIGLTVPTLLLLGNKHFGISSSMRHVCAAIIPANVKFFQYDWKKESWNLFFVGGVFIGAVIATVFLANPEPMQVHPKLVADLATYGVSDYNHLVPSDLFSWTELLTLRGFLMIVVGGFLVGFGTRYGGGCTSGHAIMGLSTLQLPSLIATISFMAGGFIMANLILPYILAL
ncbi:MAG: YeeE/YedE family protein [Lewinellaceae bacterium]|nr:YeeE/YedE family protein [Lewinellaceae bacterium]